MIWAGHVAFVVVVGIYTQFYPKNSEERDSLKGMSIEVVVEEGS
jgi:hypothetical protein